MVSANKVRSALQAMTPMTFLGLSLLPVRPVLPSHPLLSQPLEADLLSQALDLCCGQHRCMPSFEGAAPSHDRPCDPRHFVGDGDRSDASRFSGEQCNEARIDRAGLLLGV